MLSCIEIMTIVIAGIKPLRRPPHADDRCVRRDRDLSDTAQLAKDLAAAVMAVEGVPNIPMFRKNTAAFVHELPATALANVDGDSTYVRVQVLTNAGALDREKQIALVAKLTELVAAAGRRPVLYRAHMGAADRGAGGRVGPVGPRPHQRRTRRSRAC